ncbi:hypothetical protein J2S06_001085 [Bacillus alveayuensis]|uniref:Transposase n=1 Tax=Aeribacillus alveayuensis TaxID=279215 RepID=A0ABT9VM26_9BACI|nr:hypothetical protein [Bacillus alveayuensis]
MMSQLAYRVKYRRSWTDKGLGAFFKAMIAWMDGIRLFGEESSQPVEETASTASTKQTDREQGETTRPPSLAGDHAETSHIYSKSSGTPIDHALSEFKGW